MMTIVDDESDDDIMTLEEHAKKALSELKSLKTTSAADFSSQPPRKSDHDTMSEASGKTVGTMQMTVSSEQGTA